MMRVNCERLFAARRPTMTVRFLVGAAAWTLAVLLASCNKNDNVYQGWIEADVIFVAPEEVGRVQALSVREGDTVKIGDPLFYGGR
jgi:HlyD family secretion protein